MKQALFLLAVLVVAYARQAPLARTSRAIHAGADNQVLCPAYSCTGKGNACGVTFDGNGHSIAQTKCDYQLGCNLASQPSAGANYTGTCAALPTLGQPCLTTNFESNCANNLDCKSNTCQAPVNDKYPGETCSGTDVCHFWNATGFSFEDVNQCKAGVCWFIPNGQNCTESFLYQCNSKTSFCNGDATSASCAPKLAIGATCNLGNFESCLDGTCVPTSTTDPLAAGKCFAPFSSPVGTPCLSQYSCAGTLFCGKAAKDELFGKCTAPGVSATLHKSCYNASNCATDGSETCGCSSKYSKGAICLSEANDKNIKSNSEGYEKCIANAKCADSDDDCFIKNCKSQACNFFKSYSGDRYDPSANCDIPCDASTTVASLFLLAVFSIFLM